jgi:hypothetical protein
MTVECVLAIRPISAEFYFADCCFIVFRTGGHRDRRMDKQTERLTKNTEIDLQATGGQTGRQIDR